MNSNIKNIIKLVLAMFFLSYIFMPFNMLEKRSNVREKKKEPLYKVNPAMNLEEAKEFIASGKNPNITIGDTPLFLKVLAEDDNLDVVKYLVEEAGVDVNSGSEYHRDAMVYSIDSNKAKEKLEYLISKGLKFENFLKRSTYIYVYENSDVLRLLIEKGAKPSFFAYRDIIMISNDLDFLEYFLNKNFYNINHSYCDVDSPLYMILERIRSDEYSDDIKKKIDFLISKGARTDIKGCYRGETILEKDYMKKKEERDENAFNIVKEIVEKNPNDKEKRISLYDLPQNASASDIKSLIDKGADLFEINECLAPESLGYIPYLECFLQRNPNEDDIISLFNMDLHFLNRHGYFEPKYLEIAFESNFSEKAFEAIINAGGDINNSYGYGRGYKSRTLLMIAASKNNNEMILKLLKLGADKNLKGSDGETAYDLYQENKKNGVVEDKDYKAIKEMLYPDYEELN